jgi:hypothetical protein
LHAFAFAQENLKRSEFADLRALLADTGLIDESDLLVDLPSWQPTVDYLAHHHGSAFELKPKPNPKKPKRPPTPEKVEVPIVAAATSEEEAEELEELEVHKEEEEADETETTESSSSYEYTSSEDLEDPFIASSDSEVEEALPPPSLKHFPSVPALPLAKMCRVNTALKSYSNLGCGKRVRVHRDSSQGSSGNFEEYPVEESSSSEEQLPKPLPIVAVSPSKPRKLKLIAEAKIEKKKDPVKKKRKDEGDPMEAKARELAKRRKREMDKLAKLGKMQKELDRDMYGPSGLSEMLPGNFEFSSERIEDMRMVLDKRGHYKMNAYQFRKIDIDDILMRRRTRIDDFAKILRRLKANGDLDPPPWKSWNCLPPPPLSPFNSDDEAKKKKSRRRKKGEKKRRQKKGKPAADTVAEPEDDTVSETDDLGIKAGGGFRIVGHQKLPTFVKRKRVESETQEGPTEEELEAQRLRERNRIEIVLDKIPVKKTVEREEQGEEEEGDFETGPLRGRRGQFRRRRKKAVEVVEEEEEVIEVEEEEEEEEEIVEVVKEGPPVKKPVRRRVRPAAKAEARKEVWEQDDDSYKLDAFLSQAGRFDFGGVQDGWDQKPIPVPATRPTALGTKLTYDTLTEGQFRSLGRSRPKTVKEQFKALVCDGGKGEGSEGGNCTFEWLKVRVRAGSVERKKRKRYRRERMYVFGNVELKETPGMFVTFKAPTIWDCYSAKKRRNSL